MFFFFRIIAYQGFRRVDTVEAPIQTCGLVACLNDNINSCGMINYNATIVPKFPTFKTITIEANFATNKKTVVFPSIVKYKLDTLQFANYTFTQDKYTKVSLNNPETKIMTFGIFANTNTASGLFISKLALMLAIVMYCKKFLEI